MLDGIQRRAVAMRGLIVGVVTAGAVLSSMAVAPSAHAEGQCLFQGDWNCTGQPQWNGQLQQTWEVPPYTWGPGQLQCDPYTTVCYPIAHP